MNNVANDPAYASERASLAARLVGLKDRITVSLSPPTVAADGTSGTTATARIIDVSGNPRAGLHPSLSVSGDARTSPVSDNGDGTYSARITASTTPGDQTVTFAEGDVDGRAVVHFVPPIQLAVTPDVVPADGLSTAKATVTLVGPDGSPAPGRVVAVTTNGDATIAPAIDNGDGTYTATIKASRTPDDETITATAGAVRATAALHEVDSRITVRLKKDTLVADGRSTTTATATVTDLSGRPRSGRTVTITTSGDAAV